MTIRSFAAVAAFSLTAFVSAQSKAPGFDIEIEHARLPVLSQGSTGTCWSFATTSFLESEIQRIHGEQIDLSEIYTVYWAYVEKARRYVRLHGKTQFSQGGLSHDVIAIAQRYGVVPNGEFTGMLEGQDRHSHGKLEKELTEIVKTVASARRPDENWEDAIFAALNKHLGTPPQVVKSKGMQMSPQQYAREMLQLPLDDYVELMSYDYTPFGQEGELLVPDNWMRFQRYWNMPIDELMANLDHAVKNGYTVAIDCDVSERTNSTRGGLFKLSKELESGEITDDMRIKTFDNRETTDDHLMHIVGIAKNDDGTVHYLTKNSWGPIGPFGGNLMMSRNYVALKTLAIMVHKDGLLPETRKRFEKAE